MANKNFTTFAGGRFAWLCLVVCLTACSGKPSATSHNNTPESPAWFKVDPATAGTITGRVLFAGKKPAARKIRMEEDPVCARLHPQGMTEEAVAVNKDGALANAFVYLRQGLEEKKFEPPADAVIINQQGCTFAPRVLGIQVGQTLKVVNSDPLTHNIHPMPQHNRDWNQSQPPGAEPLARRFTQPEVMIRVKCNIHSWMHAWVGVVAHPYFAVTGADGAFQLRNVPPGNYTLEVWQEHLGRQEQSVTIAPAGSAEVVFKFKGDGSL